MAKILPASCVTNVVTVEGLSISPVSILSQGTKSSSGIASVDQDNVTYITSNASDIVDLITNIGTLIDKIVTVLSGLDAVSTNPGSNAATIALLVTYKTVLLAQGSNLK